MLSHPAAAVQQAVVQIDHDEPVFRYRARFVAPNQTSQIFFQRSTDGREIESGDDEVSRMYWDGTALVSESRSGRGFSVVTTTWRFELLEDGQRLRATERISGGGQDQHNVWEFVRQ